jgi:hypothetical protein
MDNILLNSAASVLSCYQQNVDARASCARFEMDPGGKPSDRIVYDCGLPDQAVNFDFVRSCLTFSQTPKVGYDKLLLSFDEIFSAYLKAIGHRPDWRS